LLTLALLKRRSPTVYCAAACVRSLGEERTAWLFGAWASNCRAYYVECAAVAPLVRRIHLHDNLMRTNVTGEPPVSEHPIYGLGDLHLPPGRGAIPLEEMFRRVDFPENPACYVELSPDFYSLAPEALRGSPRAHRTGGRGSVEWAMLGSNQRPLPCEVRSVLSWLFAAVQKYLQISIFFLRSCRPCSSLFAWVGVLLVYRNLGKLAPTGGFMEIAPPPPSPFARGIDNCLRIRVVA
jgi:hypothetical protein